MISTEDLDVTAKVNVADPYSVSEAVIRIFQHRYPDEDFNIVQRLYQDFSELYQGRLTGFHACDTSYHDMRHVLDVSLAAARLFDGYDCRHVSNPLGPELAVTGLIVALFHDSGYIRRADETDVKHGAEFTKIHVSRSGQFMAEYLPTIGLENLVDITGKLVHFTGYELMPDQIDIADPQYRTLGALIGTADIIAQMADPKYLEKCRDRLYGEFEIGGLTKKQLPDGSEEIIYDSPEHLLEQTPSFIKKTIQDRLDGHFDGLYHYVEVHFGGRNLYMEALEKNCRHLEQLIAKNDPGLLNGSTLLPNS